MKRKMDLRAIVMSLFALAAIIVIMLQLQRLAPKAPEVLEKLSSRTRIGVVDSSYINLPYAFIWTMPSNLWRLEILSSDTVLSPLVSDQAIEPQIHWLAAAQRRPETEIVAQCRIGVLSDSAHMPALDLALNLLSEVLQSLEGNSERATILQPVTSPAHQTLKGAYFIVVAPGVNSPVVVRALLPRRDIIYVVECKTLQDDYQDVREELQEIIQRFYPLPALQQLY